MLHDKTLQTISFLLSDGIHKGILVVLVCQIILAYSMCPFQTSKEKIKRNPG